MHEIKQVPEPRWARRYPLPYKARYWDGAYIFGASLAADPLTAYHGAVLTALTMHEQNVRLQAKTRTPGQAGKGGNK